MKLSQQDIINIDRYLANAGVKYIDVRYELIDHLVSEYESLDNYPDLESFLKTKLTWCRKIEKEKRNTIHWGYQRELWAQFFELFKNIKSLTLIILLVAVYYALHPYISFKIFRGTALAPLIILIGYQVYLMFFEGIRSKKQKQVLSKVYLYNIFSLPNLFLYVLPIMPYAWKNNLNFLLPYLFIGVLLNVAAILIFKKKRSKLLTEYDFLKEHMA